jgi:hypothetical protein
VDAVPLLIFLDAYSFLEQRICLWRLLFCEPLSNEQEWKLLRNGNKIAENVARTDPEANSFVPIFVVRFLARCACARVACVGFLLVPNASKLVTRRMTHSTRPTDLFYKEKFCAFCVGEMSQE